MCYKQKSKWKTTHSVVLCGWSDEHSRGQKWNERFDDWLKNYGGYGKVKYTCGSVHNYLGMKFDLSN